MAGPLRQEASHRAHLQSLTQSRRLERHCVRGLPQTTLHCLMAVLTYQSTALVSAQQGAMEWMRWVIPKVA